MSLQTSKDFLNCKLVGLYFLKVVDGNQHIKIRFGGAFGHELVLVQQRAAMPWECSVSNRWPSLLLEGRCN